MKLVKRVFEVHVEVGGPDGGWQLRDILTDALTARDEAHRQLRLPEAVKVRIIYQYGGYESIWRCRTRLFDAVKRDGKVLVLEDGCTQLDAAIFQQKCKAATPWGNRD